TLFLQPFDATPAPSPVNLTGLGVDPEIIPPATVSIVSSLNPALSFPMPLDAHLSYAQVHDLVWTALDQDTSIYSLGNTIQPGDWIVLKPNIVAAPIKTKNGSRWTNYWYNNIPHPGQATDLRVIKSVIEYLAIHTTPRRITIAEGSSEWGKLGETGTSSAVINDGWTAQWPDFGNLSYAEIVNSINSTYPNLVDIVDLSYDAYRTVPVPDPHGSGIGGLFWDEYAMPATLLDCDRWIDMPVMKTHFIAGVSLAHKSRIGSIANQAYNDSPNSQYFILQEQGNEGIRRCLIDLMSLRPADYVITEGLWGTAGNGPQWGENIQHNVIIASHDPVAADAAGAVIMGFNPWDLEYLHWSSQKGFGMLDFEKIVFSVEKPTDLRRDFGKSSGYSATKIPYWGRANRNWLLNGWYGGTNLDRNYLESETDIFPTAGAANGSKIWQEYSSSSDRVDLRLVLGKYVKNCISYAFTYVNATSDLNCNLVVGADDGIKIWVNSELVLSDTDGNSFEPAEFQIPIHLNAGQNTILCKILNYD
ncbi:DUF362 domain-containing protein, partial [bacterium]|nr:DUF362 domain-containing protein [bacterium]